MKILWPLIFILTAALMITMLYVMAGRNAPRTASGTSEWPTQGGTMEPYDHVRAVSPQVSTKQIKAASKQPYIVIDRYCNRLFLRTDDTVLIDALCSTGSGGELIDSATERHWRFDTPSGVFLVHSKMENPWWRKPDWAFVEEGIPLPDRESERLDNKMMGDYAIGFGDGYFIHGTIYERLLGMAVTHGCVRLASDDLQTVYEKVHIGTLVFIF